MEICGSIARSDSHAASCVSKMYGRILDSLLQAAGQLAERNNQCLRSGPLVGPPDA